MKTEHFDFYKALKYAEPARVNLPHKLRTMVLEIGFPNGLCEIVSRDTTLGATRTIVNETQVEFAIYVKHKTGSWCALQTAILTGSTREDFTQKIVLKFEPTATYGARDLKIERVTPDSTYHGLKNNSYLCGIEVTYEPKTLIVNRMPSEHEEPAPTV